MVSVAHWLDTFTCSKYADRFERSGYLNLQSICQLTSAQLQSWGVASADIYTIMENVLLLKQSIKSLNTPRSFDLNSEPPPSSATTTTARSRTASPAVNTLNRSMSQSAAAAAYSPARNVSTPPASGGPSPDRGMTGPSQFDTPSAYHRSNSYSNPINPNTFFDISPSSSTSSPHRSTSIDTAPPPPPPPLEPLSFNEFLPQPSPHQFQPPPPGMMHRGAVYYNTHPPRFYSPEQQQSLLPPQQQQQYMYHNQRMLMHPQQQPPHGPWAGHRPPPPHPMHYHPNPHHPYEHHHHHHPHHPFRMPPPQQYCHPNHPLMSDQNSMFLNQSQLSMMSTSNLSSTNKLAPGESHPHPLQSLERLVLLPESQVIDPKSVVNEIHDPQSPFSESLSPYGALSPKGSVSTPPTATIVSNLLTNEKSIVEHPKGGATKRSSTHDDRNETNKKTRLSASSDPGSDSIISNHPVVTSLLTRGLNNATTHSPPQVPLPSIKSLQQKHNNPAYATPPLSYVNQPLGTAQQPMMMFPPNSLDPQQFVDGSMLIEIDSDEQNFEQDYDGLIIRLRLSIDTLFKHNQQSDLLSIPSQLDGLSETTSPKSNVAWSRTLRTRHLSTSSDTSKQQPPHTTNGTNHNSPPIKPPPLETFSSDPTPNSSSSYKRNGSIPINDHHSDKHRKLSENNIEIVHTNGIHSKSSSPLNKLHKPSVVRSPSDVVSLSSSSSLIIDEQSSITIAPIRLENDDDSSSSNSTYQMIKKPIREAKKRSLIYTGNTREFLAAAVAAGIMEDIGDDEDEDNEYVPPGGTVTLRNVHSSSSSTTTSDDNSATDSSSDDEVKENDHGNEKNEKPSESGINWNVRNRPQRQTHLIRFDTIPKEDEQSFFVSLQEQAPELASYLDDDDDDNSADEFLLNTQQKKELMSDVDRELNSKKSSIKKNARRRQSKEDNNVDDNHQQIDDEATEIMKKFRHVNVVVNRKKTKKKISGVESTTTPISLKNRADELFVIIDHSQRNSSDIVAARRNIVSGANLETIAATRTAFGSNKKISAKDSFHFPRQQPKLSIIEDPKAHWCCVLCWKDPYENYLGPLFGPYSLNEQCRTFLNNNKNLAKSYRKLKEVWLHRDCALWNNHIQMSPTTGDLLHVSDACSTYLDITCSACQVPGAALACRYRNCKIRYHYPCARATANCRLIEENYSIYCPKHHQAAINKSKSRKASERSNT